MLALATAWPPESSACTVRGWKAFNVHCTAKHATWPSPAMILRLATVCAAATRAPDRATSIAAITIILDRDKTSSWFRGNTNEIGMDAERITVYHYSRSAGPREGKKKEGSRSSPPGKNIR